MDYGSALHETRTNAEHSETAADFRVSYESLAPMTCTRCGKRLSLRAVRNAGRSRSAVLRTEPICGVSARWAAAAIARMIA